MADTLDPEEDRRWREAMMLFIGELRAHVAAIRVVLEHAGVSLDDYEQAYAAASEAQHAQARDLHDQIAARPAEALAELRRKLLRKPS